MQPSTGQLLVGIKDRLPPECQMFVCGGLYNNTLMVLHL